MWESICLPLLGNDTVKENDRAFDMNDLAYTSFDTILYIEPRNMEQGHPTAIFGKISVRKTIWDLEFSEHLL